jgi:hypothetical protein
MGELANDSGFPEEVLAAVAPHEVGGKEFDRHRAVDEGVMAAHNLTVGADPYCLENLVTTDLHG